MLERITRATGKSNEQCNRLAKKIKAQREGNLLNGKQSAGDEKNSALYAELGSEKKLGGKSSLTTVVGEDITEV